MLESFGCFALFFFFLLPLARLGCGEGKRKLTFFLFFSKSSIFKQNEKASCLGDYPSVGLDAHSLWSVRKKSTEREGRKKK